MRNYNNSGFSSGSKHFFSFEKKLVVAFAAIIGVLALIFYKSSVIDNTIANTIKWIDHTEEVLLEGEKVNYLFKDLLAADRGYLITGFEEFNKAFTQDTVLIKIHLKKLSELTADNPDQQLRLKKLDSAVALRIRFSRILTVLKNEKGFEASKKLMQGKEGIKISSQIERLISALEHEEQALLDKRKKANEISIRNENALEWLLQITLVLILLAVLYIIITTLRMRAKAEKELGAREAWFSKTLSGIAEGIIATDERGNINFLNPVAEQLTGWTINETRDKFISDIFHFINETTRTAEKNPVERVIQVREPVKLTNYQLLIKKEKSEVPIDYSAAPIFNMEKEFIGVAVVLRNVEQERNAAKILEQKVEERTAEVIKSEKRYHDTLEIMLEGIQIIDKDWKYVYVNEAGAKQGNYTASQMIGHTMMEMRPGIENSVLFKSLRKCMDEREAIVFEYEFTNPDGSAGCFELSLQPVPEGIFILSINISDRKKAENEIKKLNENLEQKVIERTEQLRALNAELESFSYSVSHDLRAPLRAISGYTTILSEDYSDKIDAEGQRIMKVIQDSVKQMGQLITDLLTYAKMGKDVLNKAYIDMNALITKVAEEQKAANHEKNISINISHLDNIHADENMLKLVMANLISNAIKFSSKKEKIEIEIGSSVKENETVYFVKDNGAGFSMEYYGRLFGVFQRLHSPKDYGGTGIGLALVNRIITRHNGKVWAEGEEGKGATFYFSLPS